MLLEIERWLRSHIPLTYENSGKRVDGGQEVSHFGGVAGHFRHGSLAVLGQRGVPRRADTILKCGSNSLTTELSAIIIGLWAPLMIILFNRRHATNQ